MRIAYIVPETTYKFFAEIIPHLEAYGHTIVVNPPSLDCFDVAWAAMLPQTVKWIERLRKAKCPVIVWHWDQFSFVDYQGNPGWRALYEFMPTALDIWSASYETARQLKASHGYDSWVASSLVNPQDFAGQIYSGNYVFYAASTEAFHKRVSWVQLACERLGIPFRQTYQGPQGMTRPQYCSVMRSCRCCVMAAFEESNGTIPTLEAAVCNKPVLLSDLPATREEFGDTATYFKTWEFGDLLERLRDVYGGKHPPVSEARERVMRLFSVENVARKIAGRLKELEIRL